MIITCPSCATRYKVPDGTFGDEGRNVRCKSCSFEWMAVPDENLPQPAVKPSDADEDVPMAEEPPLTGKWPTVDIETATARRKARQDKAAAKRRAKLSAVAIAASLLIGVFSLYNYRNSIVSMVPAAGPVYELVGLKINIVGFDFANVEVKREFDNGLPVLTVAGDVVNVSSQLMAVPRVRFGLRDGSQQEIYHWTVAVSQDALSPGDRARFSTKLAAPPTEAHDILLRFNGQGGGGRRQALLSSQRESPR